jgi:hypothetical protein
VFLAAGVLSGLGGVVWLVRGIRFRRRAFSTWGTVIRHERQTCYEDNLHPTTLYYPVVEYQDANGKTRQVTMQAGSARAPYAANARVPILYDLDCPEEAEIQSFGGLWIGPSLCTALGAMFVAIVVLDWLVKFPIQGLF